MAELALAAPYNEVVKRDGTTVIVENFKSRTPAGLESFSSGSAGFVIKDFEKFKFEGSMVIEDLSRAFPTLAIRDFADRALSSFTLSGLRFNAGPSGDFSAVTTSERNQTLDTTPFAETAIYAINVEKFPDSGHVFTANRQLIEYYSKVQVGPGVGILYGYQVNPTVATNVLNIGDELVQFSGPE